MLCQRQYFTSSQELAFRSEREKMTDSLSRIRTIQPVAEEKSGLFAALANLLTNIFSGK